MVLKKKLLTDGGRWTTDAGDDGRQHIAKGHMSDSGDLKTLQYSLDHVYFPPYVYHVPCITMF